MSAENPSSAGPQAPASGGGGGGAAIALNIGYVKSIPGILKIVQFFLLMIAFACVADTIGSGGRKSFFLFVTITCWLLVITVFVIFLLSINKMITVDWNIVILVNSVLWAVLLLISSALLADNVADLEPFKRFVNRLWDNLAAGVVFGFFSLVAVAVDGAYHLIFGVMKKE